ncbi:hypothetical protein BGW36DRAFT_188061 [Talaromyces proteolyticus]|uniref:FAD-binding domain-containing protein n=1 Tax=Talaromyces proteolyticus TaxID=1131652 RepID=A0AAD4PXL3_9EURO|nr:uncharacterized protein BGW36DRAFT_188061 [Talaromyces proteolyticus]KAH8696499.1 hypothetical protein BGW36DRAFT_188061 [Talaromyces proteolyticus]
MHPSTHVVVIGAGIGGLTLGVVLRRCGLRVTILEQALKISDIGAGIQLAPNATRILRRFGLLDEILKHANHPSGTIIRRYCDDAEIGPRAHKRASQSRFDTPMLVIHRGDLQNVLREAALREGVLLRTNARVTAVDTELIARVTLASGEQVVGDVLVGADGVNSIVRRTMATCSGLEDRIMPTGDAAYRILIPRDKLVDNVEFLTEIDELLSTRWLGPDGHIMAYPIRGNTLYNVVMVHPQKMDANSDNETDIWVRKGHIKDLCSFYGKWSPRVQQLVGCIDPAQITEWPLNTHSNLPTWFSNRACLLGDACHPMLPYVAQGAAQAMEDSAALGVCLFSADNLQTAFSTYESVRKERAEYIQGSASAMRKVLHLYDGPEQKDRDARMRAPRTSDWKHPDLWEDPSFQELVWAHDVVLEVQRKFASSTNFHQKMSNVNLCTNGEYNMKA